MTFGCRHGTPADRQSQRGRLIEIAHVVGRRTITGQQPLNPAPQTVRQIPLELIDGHDSGAWKSSTRSPRSSR